MKTFDIITEADARVLSPGETVTLSRRGHVTPLALDTLRERKVTVVREGSASQEDLQLAPPAEIRTLAIASDHTGVKLRRDLIGWLRGRGLAVADHGTDSTEPVDYPDIAALVGRAVARGEADAGIVIDGAGIGSAIAANKLRGIRAAMATTETIARYSREHNGQRPDPWRIARHRRGGAGDCRSVAGSRDARTTVHSTAEQDSRSGAAVVTRAELQRLIELVVEEVSAAAAAPRSRCSCHAVASDCCPDRLQGVLEAGATRVGVHAAGGAPASVAALIDHTLLKPDATRQEIDELCREAAQFGFATVCVNPAWVAHAARRLQGASTGVCSVVGFPLGATTADVKGYETRRAIYDGAREIDMVINIGALKSGDLRTVERDIEAVTATCRECGVQQRMIIEAVPHRR
jgi:hypothetical protein